MTQKFHSWVYSKKTTKALIWKDTGMTMSTAALFTIAKIWKQPKCPSTDKEDAEDTYNGIQLSQKEKWSVTICNNMDELREHHAKSRKSEKDKYCMMSHMETKKHNNLVNITQNN